MNRAKFYLVSEDYTQIQKMRAYCESEGLDLEVYSHSDWSKKLQSRTTHLQPVSAETPVTSLSQGHTPVGEVTNTNNVIMFPQRNTVQSMDQVESEAIEKAIFEFGGNLTEAAKALGIGRATLYRKVKLYGIDPNLARRRKAAA